MRHLLQPTRSFTTSLRSIIINKTQQMKGMKELETPKFEKHLKNLYLDESRTKKKIYAISERYKSLCLTAGKPIDTLLKDFLNTSKKYKQEQIVEAVVYMGKIFQMNGMDHEGRYDISDMNLFENPNFDHFIQEVKFCLSERSYVSMSNTTKILKGFIKMRHPDMQIIKLVMMKIQKFLKIEKEDQINFSPRLYQIEKKEYYSSQFMGVDDSLLSNEVFLKNIKFFEDKKKYLTQKQVIQTIPKNDIKQDEHYHNIIELLNSCNNLKKGAEHFVESIIAIRQQYYKMSQISKEFKVLMNPSLNFQLLDVEEKLLQMHIITIQDIQNPQGIINEAKELAAVEKATKQLSENLKFQNFQNSLIDTEHKSQFARKKNEREIQELTELIQALTQYATLSHRLFGEEQRASLLSVRWQRQLLGENHYQKNLHVDKIFLRSFAEMHIFLSRHLSMLEVAIMNGTQKSKLYWLNSLLTMGYYQDAELHLNNFRFQNLSLRKITNEQFLTLLKLLSYFKQIREPKYMQQNFMRRIKKILDNPEERQVFNHHNLCDVINYLYQRKLNEHTIYKELIEELCEQIKHFQNNSYFPKEELREAFRILLFENQIQHKFIGLLQYTDEITQNSCNPFYHALNTFCNHQTLKTSSNNFPFIMTGVDENKKQTAFYIVPSNCSSLSGSRISGNISSFCQRANRELGIVVTPISLNQFLELVYSSDGINLNDSPTVKMCDVEEIVNTLDQYRYKPIQNFRAFIQNLTINLGKLVILHQKDNGLKLKANKILNSIQKMIILHKKQKNATLLTQFYVRRAELLAKFSRFKRDINLLTKKQINKLDQMCGFKIIQQFENVQRQLQEMLPLREDRGQMKMGEDNLLKGKRLTMNVFENLQKVNQDNVELEMVDFAYYYDSKYVQYSDWWKGLKTTSNIMEVKFQDMSQMGRLLTEKFCPNSKQVISTLSSHNFQMYAPKYPLNWKNKYKSSSLMNRKELEELQQLSALSKQAKKMKDKSNKQQNLIIALQNFKHQLKMSKTPEQICKYILSFKFIDDILLKSQQKSERNQVHFICRDPEEYFNFLERKNDKSYLESPFLEFIVNKIEKTEELKEKIEDRKKIKIEAQMLFQRGQLTKKQYFDRIREVDENLIEDMKGLRKKLIGHANGHTLLEDPRKLIDLQKNIEDLQNSMGSSHFFNQTTDEDLLSANGDYKQALKLKRAKAEQNLILFKIFYTLSKNQQLSTQQEEYLNNWRQRVKKGIDRYQPPTNFTRLSLKGLYGQDKERLLLHNTNLPQNYGHIALNDLVLELNNFFDESFITIMQAGIISKHFQKQKNIPREIFKTTRNREFNYLSHEVQGKIFKEKEKFTEKDIEQMIELTKIFKTQGVSSRYKYASFYQTVVHDLKLINQQRFRKPLMKSYLKCKDNQFYKSYFPEDVKGQKIIETETLWKQIFEKSSQHTTSTLIRQKVQQLCKSMIGLKIHRPPFFGNLVLKILSHNNTDILTKQKLIAFLQIFKIPLQLDSQDLLSLVQNQQQKTKEQLMEKMKKISEKDMVKKFQELL